METNPATEGTTPTPSKKNNYQNLDDYLSECGVSLTNATAELPNKKWTKFSRALSYIF